MIHLFHLIIDLHHGLFFIYQLKLGPYQLLLAVVCTKLSVRKKNSQMLEWSLKAKK